VPAEAEGAVLEEVLAVVSSVEDDAVSAEAVSVRMALQPPRARPAMMRVNKIEFFIGD
jgi:hypothetical protein